MTSLNVRSTLRVLWTAAAILVFLSGNNASPIIGVFDKANNFLAKYGYLGSPEENLSRGRIIDDRSRRAALAKFQHLVDLKAIGELDNRTTDMIDVPRCGVTNEVDTGENGIEKYKLNGKRWLSKELTYKISKYSSKLRRAEVDSVISRAFSEWSKYTDLTFTQKQSGLVHIDIRFVTGKHEDDEAFDGPSKVLAHALFPFQIGKNFSMENWRDFTWVTRDTDNIGPAFMIYSSFIHFDDDENWTIDSREGIDLSQVAVHEIGHVLGLHHSDEKSAIMYANYNNSKGFLLHEDDIAGIQVSKLSNYMTINRYCSSNQ